MDDETDRRRGAATLGPAQLAELLPYGEEHDVDAGDVLFSPADETYDFWVVLHGEVEILRPDPTGDVLVTVHGDGRFLGELSLLTGQRPYLVARVSQPGRVLRIRIPEFRRLMSEKAELADIIFRALMARREALRTGEGARAVKIIGSRFDGAALALRASPVARSCRTCGSTSRTPTTSTSCSRAWACAPVTRPSSSLPTRCCGGPHPGEFAQHLGLTFRAPPGYTFDLVVVGSGPAGLAAAVYGASEGLSTVSLDAVNTGGQAGTSSRIENYVGFPNGISGGELTARAAIQAQRLGARLNAPCPVAGLREEHGFLVVELADGSEVPSRSVIVASGARYQRLAVDELERFEGSGVYYAATDLEARQCCGAGVDRRRRRELRGPGRDLPGATGEQRDRSASVATTWGRACRATSSSASMPTPGSRCAPRPRCVPSQVSSTSSRSRSSTRRRPSGARSNAQDCSASSAPIPRPSGWASWWRWTPGGSSSPTVPCPPPRRRAATFRVRDPLPFETSVPGVFAVGDVRHGSLKRVAAAVGEGSSAVRSVHEHLASAGVT